MPESTKPNYFWSLLTCRCPRCRKGPMFTNNNPWILTKVFSMHPKCPECGQPYELEVGFWYGTGYVSYLLSVIISILTLVVWYVLIGMSARDNRFFWWLGVNIFLLIVLQPWLMRVSRAIYLYFFVKYNPDYKNTAVTKFDYETGAYYEKEE